MLPYVYAKHARARSRQRGIPTQLIEGVISYADIETDVGSGCTALRFSRKAARSPEIRRALGAQADRAHKLVVIVADAGQTIVTALHDHVHDRRLRRSH